MPQRSHGFSVGRVRVLEGNLLNRAALDRLISVSSVDELARALTELGWGEAKTKRDIDLLSEKQVHEAASLVKEDTPDQSVTDCFLLKYDTLNLKVLLKSRVLGLVAEDLSPSGTLDAERLSRAVAENSYIDLPDILKVAMLDIEKRIAVSMDPLYVDTRLDKAMFELIEQKLATCKDETVLRYFKTKADFVNMLIALRSALMERSSQFAKEQMVPFGMLGIDDVAKLADEPDRAVNLTYLQPYAGLIKDALGEHNRKAAIALLEKRMDDYLLALIRPHRYESQSVLPLIGYLLAREREAAAVRLVATAKEAQVPGEKLTERLRELYA